ncbi:MAG: penicillin-binding protein 1C [Nitrosomonadales bacterium]|nr:penicillin-binding protein 1C [Nitrosomonadales bacterium]
MARRIIFNRDIPDLIAFTLTRRFTRRVLIAVALGLALFFAAMVLLPRILPKQPLLASTPSSVAVYDADRNLLRLTLASDEQYRLLLPLTKVSPELVEAVLLYEDRGFRWHPGFNPWSLSRAAFATATGQRRMGGSTLTMQLARRIYHLDTHTVPGKLLQILRAVQLELLYTKDEILEAYLSLAPYGGNVEGVAAASLIYFAKPADKLTLPEALTLAVIPQNPLHRAPDQPGLLAARDRLFALWCARHPEAERLADLLHLPIQVRSTRSLPFLVPHFVRERLAARHAEHELMTTIDPRLQRLLERRLHAYVERQKRLGVNNASAMLVDMRDMGVKAAVGSADFFDDAISGQVSALTARRSPGSTLKPFIYALAMDQGLIHPMTVLKDSAQSFGGYTPENFDGRFIGPLTATDALNHSRNLPAIALASRLDKPSLYEFLQAAGISRMASERHYGLALVLGGGEISMEELVQLYAMLANKGKLRPLRMLEQDRPVGGTSLLSEEASFMVLDMLRQNPRPDMAVSSGIPAGLPVHWKTGTSNGFRDAWTVGIFGPYVLAVWLGNFDNTPNPALIGIHMAAPLFFELVDSINAAQPGLYSMLLQQPPNLSRVEVCTASGDLPNADCPQRSQTWFIPGKSPIRVSTLHRKLVIDNASGLVACPPNKPGRTRSEVFEFWTSDMLDIFRQAGLPRRLPPAHDPRCADNGGGTPPQITSPMRGVTYTMRLSKDDEQTILLQATMDASVSEIYWFAGEQYLGKAARNRPLTWQPRGPGYYVLRAVDDVGRSDTREVTVSIAQ